MLADDVLPYSSMLTGNFARSVFIRFATDSLDLMDMVMTFEDEFGVAPQVSPAPKPQRTIFCPLWKSIRKQSVISRQSEVL